MRKVVAIVGSPHKKATHFATRKLLDELEALGGVETEIVHLAELELGLCRGCKACFTKGESRCPLRDDRDLVLAKMAAADGVVFATPNYSFQVSALMKLFLDRLGFVFHRPRFFEKTFTSVVVQGIHGARKIERYLDFVGKAMGFETVRGSCHTALDPMSELEKRKIDRALEAHARRFHRALAREGLPAASWLGLVVFRLSRTTMRLELDATNLDWRYYGEQGWFESDYYFPVRLGWLKRAVGRLIDRAAAMASERRLRAGSSARRCCGEGEPAASAAETARPDRAGARA